MAIQRAVPGPGQESVWDYPRPPRVEPSRERVVVRLGGEIVVSTRAAVRVLETSHPPTYYLPAADFAPDALASAPGASMCEFKGRAAYLDVRAGGVIASRAAWTYPSPLPGYESLRGMIALYPGAMDACEIGGELVRAQDGDFYGGWITDRIVGPFKGAPGTLGW
ncbi:DUF427 domain-containing protein [Homoserinibacter sp. YIM 151385]|uniref:DUF427 domain-containing protein n=1 Tax=Homoserinibacter sp. YIM 151385 TaxID=2985506 RepID=UPI0022F098DC|nr:DUF427 domain-containing protein [Homoserinibacter sp. YIM 151385]WBU39094.1 DUF427 domain-containing protein [Homoserinibacter sp. YIM 151385]